jgi:plastocyanin domain-containing protein
MDKILVIIASLALIALVLWWFFGPHESSEASAAQQAGTQTATITVQGGYRPETITLKQGVPAALTFIRKDPSSCLEEVILPDFGVSQKLPLGQPHTLTINPDKPGEFSYSCGMRMYHGKLVVKGRGGAAGAT